MASGLDAPVRWVHISELEDPTPFLSGGELLLTTGMQLTTPTRSARTSPGSPRTGSPGSASAPASRTTTCPRRSSRPPTKHGFPLFEVPYELPFIALTEKAFTHLVNEQYAVLRRALAAHERLERIVLSEQGLDGVAGALSALIGGPALVFDGRGEVLAASSGPPSRRSSQSSAPSCASAPARARAAGSPRAASSRAARWRCRSRARRGGGGDGRCRRRGSWPPRTTAR